MVLKRTNVMQQVG